MARTKAAAKKGGVKIVTKPQPKHVRSQEAVSRQVNKILPTVDEDEVGMLFKNINNNIKLFKIEFVQGNKRIAEDYIFKALDQARDVEDRLFPFEEFGSFAGSFEKMEASTGECDWQERFKRMKNNFSICRLHYLRKDFVPLKKNLKKLLRNASFLLLFVQNAQ